MFNIEKNIEMPKCYGVGRPEKYPFAEMEIGDSVFFDNEPRGSTSNVSVAARLYSKRKDGAVKFVSRKEGNGVRIWRVA